MPYTGYRAIPLARSYTTSGLTSFRQLTRFPETHVSSLQEHQFQHRNSRNAPCTPYCLKKRDDSQESIEEVGNFRQAPQEEFSLSSRYVRGTQCFLSQVERTREALTENKAGIPCSGLNSGSSFISQDEGMSESPVETLVKTVGHCLIWRGSLTSL